MVPYHEVTSVLHRNALPMVYPTAISGPTQPFPKIRQGCEVCRMLSQLSIHRWTRVEHIWASPSVWYYFSCRRTKSNYCSRDRHGEAVTWSHLSGSPGSCTKMHSPQSILKLPLVGQLFPKVRL